VDEKFYLHSKIQVFDQSATHNGQELILKLNVIIYGSIFKSMDAVQQTLLINVSKDQLIAKIVSNLVLQRLLSNFMHFKALDRSPW
jgi:hypothetical protein